MHRMAPLFFYMFFSLFFWPSSSVGLSNRAKLARYPLLEDKNITAAVISKSTNDAAALCAKPCVDSDTCQSFFYNTITGECQYHETLFTSPAGAKDQKGLEYYYIIKDEGRNDWCPVDKGFQLLTDNGPCVKLHTDKKTWYEANQTCVSYSPFSRLVVLDNQEKQDLVKTAGMAIDAQFTHGLWIGLLEETDDVYRWTDGGEVGFSVWGYGDYSTVATVDCVYLRRSDDWRWTKADCTRLHHYTCEVVVDIISYHQMMGNNG